jgi:hypothetical protein
MAVLKDVEKAVGRTTSENLKSWIIKKILPFVNKTTLVPRLKGRTFGEYANLFAKIEEANMKGGDNVMPYMVLAMRAKNMMEKQQTTFWKCARDLQKVICVPVE